MKFRKTQHYEIKHGLQSDTVYAFIRFQAEFDIKLGTRKDFQHTCCSHISFLVTTFPITASTFLLFSTTVCYIPSYIMPFIFKNADICPIWAKFWSFCRFNVNVVKSLILDSCTVVLHPLPPSAGLICFSLLH